MSRGQTSIPAVLLVCGAFLGAAPQVTAGSEDSAQDVLKEKGIRVVGTSLALIEETELLGMLGSRGDGARLKRELDGARKKLSELETQAEAIKQQSAQLRQELIRFGERLSVARNNQIVSALEVLRTQLDEREKQIKEARGTQHQAQEAYVDHLLAARKLADKLKGDYARLAADPEVAAAVERLNRETGRTYELTESRSFLTTERNLKRLEDAVLSESIDLRSDGSDTFYVNTVLNGDHARELVVDSGASLVTLPYRMAVEVGLEPGETAEDIRLQLADGRLVEAKRVTIPVMRVGKFELEEVDCAVMPADLPNAAAILGMSFLRHFSFQIDADAAKLTMTSIDAPDADGEPRSRTRRPPRR